MDCLATEDYEDFGTPFGTAASDSAEFGWVVSRKFLMPF
jgi:hypothetical protein